MPATEVDCPYVGLVPYTEEEARFFFGRARETRQIVANLFASRLTLLYGASGAGKSSVLRAGVVYELERRAERARAAGKVPEQVVVYLNKWQDDVLGRLREAVRGGSALYTLRGSTIAAEDLADYADVSLARMATLLARIAGSEMRGGVTSRSGSGPSSKRSAVQRGVCVGWPRRFSSPWFWRSWRRFSPGPRRRKRRPARRGPLTAKNAPYRLRTRLRISRIN